MFKINNRICQKILDRQNILAEKIPIRQTILVVPKNDRTYSEYSDCSENSDDSEISGSKCSDDSKNFWYNREVMWGSTLVCFLVGGKLGIVVHLLSMVSFFACTCPNRSGVGAIDNSDRFEQVFDQYDNPEDSEKNFTKNFRWWAIRKG